MISVLDKQFQIEYRKGEKVSYFILQINYNHAGTSLAVQWLRIHLPMQGTWVRSLVGELRSHMLQGT